MTMAPPNEAIELIDSLTASGWAHVAVETAVFLPLAGLAWLFGRWIDYRRDSGGRYHVATRILSPLLAAGLTLPAAFLLGHYQPVALLGVLRRLLLVLALINLALHMLRRALPRLRWLQPLQRLLALLVWLVLALHITGLLPGILDTLDSIGFEAGHQRFSLLMILEASLTVSAALVISLWLGSLIEDRLMRTDRLETTHRLVLAKVARASLLAIGILVALPVAGIDPTALSVFGGALGVGLGFGLQKIASNYVSGFIILLDRSIHPDDIVTIGDRQGIVTRLAARYTVVRGGDGTEAIIPNETLITSIVLNHTQAHSRQVLTLPVRLRPGADVARAMDILTAAARAHADTAADSAPCVFIKSLASDGTELELVVTLAAIPANPAKIRSDIYLAAWRGMREAAIRLG